MSVLMHVAVILGVVALIVVRQLRPQRIDHEGRWWLVPAVLVILAIRDPGLSDAHHAVLSGLLLGVEVVVGLLLGAAWAFTSRLWTAPDGAVWARGTRATALAWVLGIATRLGLIGLGRLLGIHQGTSALLLALAASLLVRSRVLAWRAKSLHGTNPSSVYGSVVPDSLRKEHA